MLRADDADAFPSVVAAALPADSSSLRRVSLEDGSKRGHLRARLIGLDLTAGFLTWLVVLASPGRGVWPDEVQAVGAALVLSIVVVAALGLQKLYLARVCSVRSFEMAGLARAAAVSAFAAWGLDQIWSLHLSPLGAFIAAVSLTLLLSLFRSWYGVWLRRCRAQGRFCRMVCILGTDGESEALVEMFSGQPDLGYRIVAVLGSDVPPGATLAGIPVVEAGTDLVSAVVAAGATGVVVATDGVPRLGLEQAVRQLVAAGIHVQLSSGLSRVGYQRMRLSPLSHQVLFYVERPTMIPAQLLLKRLIDMAFSAAALVVALPVMGAAAVAIKLDDGGPVLYRQERVGRHGRIFQVLKLRTMTVDAGDRLHELMEQNERNGPLFKMASDPRVTRVGRVLRESCIDELPQIFNVLRGEMSLVGPRPALPSEVERFDPELRERLVVAPGVTGLWQVEASESPSFHAYRRLDLLYVDNWSVRMDMMILGATFGLVIQRLFDLVAGARHRRPEDAQVIDLSRGDSGARCWPEDTDDDDYNGPVAPAGFRPQDGPQVVGGS